MNPENTNQPLSKTESNISMCIDVLWVCLKSMPKDVTDGQFLAACAGFLFEVATVEAAYKPAVINLLKTTIEKLETTSSKEELLQVTQNRNGSKFGMN